MAKLKANYHTHNQLCNHAVGNAMAYVEKAIALGMEEIGLSDHNPIPLDFMSIDDFMNNWCFRNMSLEIYEKIYLPEIKAAKEKYSDKISVKLGVECEYIPNQRAYYEKLREDVDYLLLGIHYFQDGDRFRNSYAEITYKNVIDYARNACLGMNTGLFKVLAHPDLFMFNYQNINGEREFDEAAEEASRMMIECAIKNDVYLEVNVNGLSNARKYNSVEWLYPFDSFWKLAREYDDLKIIIGVDAHRPDALDDKDIDDVIEFTKNLNLKICDKLEF